MYQRRYKWPNNLFPVNINSTCEICVVNKTF